jgi:hypothetical protein
MKRYIILGISCFALLATSAAMAKERIGDPYTLDYCPVSGEKLGSMGEAPVHVGDDGREVRFCCGGCKKKYVANAEAMNQTIDEKLIADQESLYPAKTCINSGAELKDGGRSFIVGNRLMKTCCAKCEAKVKADPASYIAKLDKLVIEAQSANYKLGACPVADEALGDSPVEMVVANRLIKLCCEGCKNKVYENPLAVLEKIDAAK